MCELVRYEITTTQIDDVSVYGKLCVCSFLVLYRTCIHKMLNRERLMKPRTHEYSQSRLIKTQQQKYNA